MSTSKSEVTNKFLSLINDRDLCANLTDEQITMLLDDYLKDSVYLRFKVCNKDLTDHETYDFHTDAFTADGINKTYILSDYPSTPNSDAISYDATVNGTSVDYTFTESTLTFELDNLPDADDTVEISYSFVGQFNETLSQEEIEILGWGMMIAYFSHILHKHELFKNQITPKDYNSFSSANLLDKLIQINKENKRELKKLVNSYSFNSFSGFS